MQLEKSFFIEGKNVALRGLQESDLEGDYVEWLNDPEVCKYNSHGKFPYLKEQAQKYIQSTINSKNILVLAMVDKKTKKHIGNIALQSINWIDRSAEYAILLGDKKSWGKGFSKEASDLLLKHGFLQLGLNRIYCGTSEKNKAMQALAKFMKMKKEGVRRKAIFKEGQFLDVYEYGVLKNEYIKRKER